MAVDECRVDRWRKVTAIAKLIGAGRCNTITLLPRESGGKGPSEEHALQRDNARR
jgi:hypothetical protein